MSKTMLALVVLVVLVAVVYTVSPVFQAVAQELAALGEFLAS